MQPHPRSHFQQTGTLHGNPRIRPPGLRNPPSTVPTVPTGLPLAIPEWISTSLPRKGGYPRTKGGLSLLPWIFWRHQHLPLGCQLRSPKCDLTMRPRRTLPDSVGLPPGLSYTQMGPFRQYPILTRIGYSVPLLRIPGLYHFTVELYTYR